MSVSKRARYEVLRRDGHRCRYCGRTTDDGARLTIDHVVPVSLGGVDDPGDLVAACMDCNAGKSSSPADAPLVATVSDDALRWAAAMARAGDAVLADITKHDAVLAEFDAEWSRWHKHGRPIDRPDGWQQSINAMLRTGIPITALVRLVEVPMTNKTLHDSARWRYFCGCAWRAIDKMRDLAAQELAEESRDDHDDRSSWSVDMWYSKIRRFIGVAECSGIELHDATYNAAAVVGFGAAPATIPVARAYSLASDDVYAYVVVGTEVREVVNGIRSPFPSWHPGALEAVANWSSRWKMVPA